MDKRGNGLTILPEVIPIPGSQPPGVPCRWDPGSSALAAGGQRGLPPTPTHLPSGPRPCLPTHFWVGAGLAIGYDAPSQGVSSSSANIDDRVGGSGGGHAFGRRCCIWHHSARGWVSSCSQNREIGLPLSRPGPWPPIVRSASHTLLAVSCHTRGSRVTASTPHPVSDACYI